MLLDHAGTEIGLSETEPPPPYPRAMQSDRGSFNAMLPTLPSARHSESSLSLPESAHHRYMRSLDVEVGIDLTLGVCWGVSL